MQLRQGMGTKGIAIPSGQGGSKRDHHGCSLSFVTNVENQLKVGQESETQAQALASEVFRRLEAARKTFEALGQVLIPCRPWEFQLDLCQPCACSQCCCTRSLDDNIRMQERKEYQRCLRGSRSGLPIASSKAGRGQNQRG